MTFRSNFTFISALVLTVFVGGVARAGSNLVTDGGFESTTNGTGQISNGGPGTGTTSLTAWAPTPWYTFVFGATTGDNQPNSNYSLAGPANGSNNGLTASPDGGNYFGQDASIVTGGAPGLYPQTTGISQMVGGLTPGHVYQLSFYWAGAELQAGFYGPTQQGWQVSLGDSAIQLTSVVTVPAKGFSGWMQETFSFTADATSENLNFNTNPNYIALGANSLPPMTLLDGVSLVDTAAVPEPGGLTLTAIGASIVGLLACAAAPRLPPDSIACCAGTEPGKVDFPGS